MPNLLAFDTSDSQGAIGVLRRDGRRFLALTDPAVRHGRELIPQIKAALAQAQLALADLDAIAVGLGPGSYTGLRIGVTAAKTLAYACGKPLLGIETMNVISLIAPAEFNLVHVLADAQRGGDLYVGRFAKLSQGFREPIGPLEVLRFESWAQSVPIGTLVLGPALDHLKKPLPDHLALGPPAWNKPDPGLLLDLSARRLADAVYASVLELEPLYLRNSVAEDRWERNQNRGIPPVTGP